jgi:ACR3 family arsenite efflux pump ArsB
MLSVFFANVPGRKDQFVGSLFFVGVAPLTGSLLIMNQLSKMKQELLQKRNQLAPAYSI